MASPEKWELIRQAYRARADLKYRPAAPSDGLGSIAVPVQELEADIEARDYTQRFLHEEDGGMYWAGCTDFASLKAAIWTLEAFRLMNAGRFGGEEIVPKLLRMAASEYERALDLPTG